MALENKLGLTSSADLAREEERISKKKAVALFETRLLDTLPAGKFVTLQAIHKYLFEDIYDFAGEIRTVNMAKGNFRFAPLMYLQVALENKLGLTSSADLAREEERISKKKALELFENGVLDTLPAGKFSTGLTIF